MGFPKYRVEEQQRVTEAAAVARKNRVEADGRARERRITREMERMQQPGPNEDGPGGRALRRKWRRDLEAAQARRDKGLG